MIIAPTPCRPCRGISFNLLFKDGDATYELSVVIRDLAGKDPQLTEIFVDYFTAIGITYLCMDDLLEDDSDDDMPQRCRFCDMQEECDVYE